MIYIAVVAQNQIDFKLNFPSEQVNDVKYIYVDSPLSLRGVNIYGIILTEKARYNSDKKKLCREIFFYNFVGRG